MHSWQKHLWKHSYIVLGRFLHYKRECRLCRYWYVWWQPHTPSAKACAIPKWGTLRAHKGLKCTVKHIFPPLYIFSVFPSNSGNVSSGAVVGYVTGICTTLVSKREWIVLTSNSRSNSYFRNSCINQHLPCHLYTTSITIDTPHNLPSTQWIWF